MASVSMDEVSIRCMGCSQIKTLEKAAFEGWKICSHCNFTICEFCCKNLEKQQYCLSYLCSSQNRKINLVPLPVAKIIIFAQGNYQSEYKQGLLYKLFYKDQEKLKTPAFFIAAEKEKQIIEADNKPSKVQEEIWKNFQLVITKRKGGKFITWERVM